MKLKAPSEVATSIAELPPLWSHKRAAEFLGISEATLHAMNYKRTGPRSYRVGKYRRYAPADVTAWLNAHASDCHGEVA